MPVSKAQQRAQNKWIAKAYDRINLTVPKGKKDVIQAHAEANGESVNGFINRAIDQTMAQEAAGSPARPTASKMSDTAEGGDGVLDPYEGRTEGAADGD